MLQTIAWTNDAVRLLDQTRLPTETVYVQVANERQMWDAIRRLVVRGAPAIGVAAAFGVYLGIRGHRARDLLSFYTRLNEVADYLATSRPTAVNLFWALDRLRRVARDAGRCAPTDNEQEIIDIVRQRILAECLLMLEEDARVCRAIGENALPLLLARSAGASAGASPATQRRPIHVLTHCNAGALAAVAYGTALAPIYLGHERGIAFHVWSDETRPLLQGSRITAAELMAAGVPVTVICDNMAAMVMSQGRIDVVIVGADRVAANGDVANKIGTLGVAILAKHFAVPFYVAAPTSSIDLSIPSGAEIPIEQRDPAEVTAGFGRRTAPDGVDVYNPAFDVTPAELVSAIITEKGIIHAPDTARLRQLMA